MSILCFRTGLRLLAGALIVFSCSLPVLGQPFLPVEVGTTVNGFQDDFDGVALDPNWVVSGQTVFSMSGGQLHVTSAGGDPNHLLYELPGYDSTIQEVLARIRVNNYGSG